MNSIFVAGVDFEYEEGSCAGPLSITSVPLIEKATGSRLDPAYLQQLQICNGGVPKKRYFPVPGNSKVIDRFLCIIDDYQDNQKHGPYDVDVVYTQISDRLGDNQVPFATLFGGDFLLFEDEGGPVPHVVVWDHERSGEDSPVTLAVADSFTAFLSLLYGDEEADADGNRILA